MVPCGAGCAGDAGRIRVFLADRCRIGGKDYEMESVRVQKTCNLVKRRGIDTMEEAQKLRGKVLELQLPTHLEDISSTRIRENIDLGRDISNLIDPVVQDFIYQNSLYLREPQYKQLIRASFLDFSHVEHPDRALWAQLREAIPEDWTRMS